MSLGSFSPVVRTPVSETVYQAIANEILAGGLDAGDALPSERALAEQFAVNRHAIREALKRLQQSGLVEISQGGATRVLDWRATAGLDLLAQLAAAGQASDPESVRSVLEMRLCIGADAARRCAERADAETIVALAALADGSDDDSYNELWLAIVDGARNLAYRLALNSLLAGNEALGGPVVYAGESGDAVARRALVAAITAREPLAAEAAARELLSRPLTEARHG